MDPLVKDYPNSSSFSFALNTPIQAFDPDGRLVIMVNGFRKNAYERYLISRVWFGYFGFGAFLTKPWNKKNLYERKDNNDYWGSDGMSSLVMERHIDTDAIYMDGMFTPHSTAQERYDRGVKEGRMLIERINDGEITIEAGETIKILGHSHGGWNAIGIADVLAKAGYTVEVVYVKNPHQPNQEVKRIEGSGDFRLVQFSTKTDHVSSDQSQLGMGSIAVGDSEYGQIENSELFELPNCTDCDLGGHNVNEQTDVVSKVSKGQKGYVGPQD